VTLVAGPTGRPAPRGVATVPVVSARQMLVGRPPGGSKSADVLIGAAAVADWRPARCVPFGKLKKGRTAPVLRLVPNPDVLAALSREARPGVVRVGFALETGRLLANARKKLRQKKLDLIVANPPTALGGDATRAWLLTPEGGARAFAGSKRNLARLILRAVERPCD
jgi:phosphopantothenoylcysteine decarboxylase/phosphopantothenate--cysteine ligase